MNDNNRPAMVESPKINLPPPELSTVNYEAQDEKDNSEYQVLWSKTMDKGKYRSSSSYTDVNVLLLCWAEGCDDLAVNEEVSELKRTFENRFNYHVEIKYLDERAGRSCQVQVNTKVQAFIGDHDHPTALLIVYYAGHGRPGSYFGSLTLHGQTSENDQRKQTDMLVWNKTEKLLADAEGDVLEIFDCCYAGNLCLTRGEHRLFEYLAATKEMATTPVPGQDSFTSALIYALEALVEEKGRFTTVELLRKIKKDAPNFPKDQIPVLSDRKDDVQAGRIMLQPLQKIQEGGSRAGLSLDSDTNLHALKRQTVTLHIDFSNKPSHTDIEILGQQLNQIFERYYNLGVNGVRWGGIKQSPGFRAMGSFLASLKRRRASTGQQQPTSDIDSLELQQAQVDPFLPTPYASSSNGDSPGPTDFAATNQIGVNLPTPAPIALPASLGTNKEIQGKIADRRRQHKKQKSGVDNKDSS